jgi:nitroreductase
MNAVIENIKKRRSIRKYLPEQIKTDELNAIIEAGMYAPSGHNEQSWHFTVIQDKEMLDYISSKTKESMVNSDIEWVAKMGNNEKLHIFYNAPTAVIVSGKKDAYCSLIDCSAATQNMMLAAESLNIGSCWIGLVDAFFQNQEDVEKLNIPAGYRPFYAVIFGYKLVNPSNALERKTDVISYIR